MPGMKRLPRSPKGEHPMDKSGIYLIRHIASGRIYLGSSLNMRVRRSQHIKDLNERKHSSPKLQNAWNKYGADAFEFEIVEECSGDDLFTREQALIDELAPFYNVLSFAGNGTRGYEWTDEQRKRHYMKNGGTTVNHREAGRRTIERNRANSPFGPGYFPEHRVGMKDTAEVIEKRRLARLATIRAPGYVNPNKGQKRSEEFKELMRRQNLGAKRSEEAKANMSAAQEAYAAKLKAEGKIHHNAGKGRFMWITDGVEARRHKTIDPVPEGWRQGRVTTEAILKEG